MDTCVVCCMKSFVLDLRVQAAPHTHEPQNPTTQHRLELEQTSIQQASLLDNSNTALVNVLKQSQTTQTYRGITAWREH